MIVMSEFSEHRWVVRGAREIGRRTPVDPAAARAAVEAVQGRLLDGDAANPGAGVRIAGVQARRPVRVIRYAAAVLLIGAIAGVLAWLAAESSQRALAQVVGRVEKSEAVRYRVQSEHGGVGVAKDALPQPIDLRTFATGGRYRSELSRGAGGAAAATVVIIRNPQTLPDAELVLHARQKLAEFTLVDADREAQGGDNLVDALKKFASDGVRAAPDETYDGRPVRVYVSERPEQSDGGRQSLTRRVLVDRQTGLPVRIEMDGDMTKIGQGTYHVLMEDFDWNPAIDERTFSTEPPAGYTVRYDLLRPLDRGLSAYAAAFDGRLPDRMDAAALAALAERIKAAKGETRASIYDAKWGFAVPAFAAKRKLDFRYYGAGKKRGGGGGDGARQIIAAIEIAPQSGQYDVIMSDFSRARLARAQLP